LVLLAFPEKSTCLTGSKPDNKEGERARQGVVRGTPARRGPDWWTGKRDIANRKEDLTFQRAFFLWDGWCAKRKPIKRRKIAPSCRGTPAEKKNQHLGLRREKGELARPSSRLRKESEETFVLKEKLQGEVRGLTIGGQVGNRAEEGRKSGQRMGRVCLHSSLHATKGSGREIEEKGKSDLAGVGKKAGRERGLLSGMGLRF